METKLSKPTLKIYRIPQGDHVNFNTADITNDIREQLAKHAKGYDCNFELTGINRDGKFTFDRKNISGEITKYRAEWRIDDQGILTTNLSTMDAETQQPLYPGGSEIEEVVKRQYADEPGGQKPLLPGGIEIEPEPAKEEDK